MTAPRSKKKETPAKDLPGQTQLPLDAGQEPADRLRFECRGVRLSINQLGRSKSLSAEHKREIAESLDAEEGGLSLSKRLLDSKDNRVQAVSAAIGAIENYWRAMTLPFPIVGVRLIAEGDVDKFATHVADLVQNLRNKVESMEAALPEIVDNERQRLGRAFNRDDYPKSVLGAYRARIEYVNTDPPDYLKKLRPDLYEQEANRVRQRFELAAQLAEDALTAQFEKVVSNLAERLTPNADGTKKTFMDNTVDQLFVVFDEFRGRMSHFGIGKGTPLESTIQMAQDLIKGHDREVLPNSLRKGESFRARIAEGMAKIQNELGQYMETKPTSRRRLQLD